MIYEKKYEMKSCYSGDAELVDNASILEMLTSVSKAHTDDVGIVLPEDIVWMVLDWKLRIKRRPEIGEHCRLRTWVPEWNKAFSIRCYEIVDAEGCKCAEAISRWSLASMKTRKLFRMTEDIVTLYGLDKGVSDIEKAAFIKNIAKDAAPLTSSSATICGDMIDKNGHIHNTVYSTLAESVLPDNANVDSIDISYRKEIGRDENIILEYCVHNGKNMVLIKTENSSAPNAIVLYNE